MGETKASCTFPSWYKGHGINGGVTKCMAIQTAGTIPCEVFTPFQAFRGDLYL
jgi:hypothetical protein